MNTYARVLNALDEFEYQSALAVFCEIAPDGYTKTRLMKGETAFNCKILFEELEKIAKEEKLKAQTPGPSLQDFSDGSEEVLALVREKNALYKKALYIKSTLLHIENVSERGEAGLKLLELWDKIYEAWERLDAYKESGVLPNSSSEFDLRTLQGLSARKLFRLEENNRVYILKNKNDPTRAEEVARREAENEKIKVYLDNAVIK